MTKYSELKTQLKKVKRLFSAKRTRFSFSQKNYGDPLLIDKLSRCTVESTPVFSFSTDGNRVPCKVLSVYDGDTLNVAMDHYGDLYSFKMRLAGIDTPEMKPRLQEPRRELIMQMAKKAKHFLETQTLDKIVYLDVLGQDKYGRLLCKLFRNIDDPAEASINELLIRDNYALPYDGGEKKVFPTEE